MKALCQTSKGLELFTIRSIEQKYYHLIGSVGNSVWAIDKSNVLAEVEHNITLEELRETNPEYFL